MLASAFYNTVAGILKRATLGWLSPGILWMPWTITLISHQIWNFKCTMPAIDEYGAGPGPIYFVSILAFQAPKKFSCNEKWFKNMPNHHLMGQESVKSLFPQVPDFIRVLKKILFASKTPWNALPDDFYDWTKSKTHYNGQRVATFCKLGTHNFKSGTCQGKSGTCQVKSGTCQFKSGTVRSNP